MTPRFCSRCWRPRTLRISPDNADLVADDERCSGCRALGRAAPRLASALRTSPAPFVLMLDDLHELQLAGLSRCAQRGDLGDSCGLSTGRGESF